MKLLKLTVLLAALNPFLGETALGISSPPKPQHQNIAKYEVNTPVCYMETTTGTTVDLSKLCETNSVETPKINTASTRRHYNYKEMRKFNYQVYGEDE